MSIAAVVVSKDRPAQLELLLRSWSEQVPEWPAFAVSVLWKGTAPEFDRGYEVVAKAFPTVFMQREDESRPFQRHVLALMEREAREFFQFLTDDIVFIGSFATADEPFQLLRRRADIGAVALRMSPRINYSQPLGMRTPPPRLRRNIWTWQPLPRPVERLTRLFGVHSAWGDWRLQINFDGNVLRYAELLAHCRTLPDAGNPQLLERLFVEKPLPAPNLVCYPESKLINLALNRVDSMSLYPSARYSTTEFNDRFLGGERLSYRKLVGLRHNACHIEVAPEWFTPAAAR